MENQDISVFIGTVVGLYPIETVNLLRKNNFVAEDRNPNDLEEILALTFTALETSVNFRIEFVDLFLNNEEEVKSKFKGGAYLNNNGTTPSKGSGLVQIGTTLIGGGLQFFQGKQQLDAAKVTANATIKANQLQVDAQRLALEGKKLDAELALKLAGQAEVKDNTALYIGLGIGGLLIVGLLVVMLRKK